MHLPYICTSDRTVTNRPVSFSKDQGITYQSVQGEHAIWAARIAFLPAMMSEDFTGNGKNRISMIVQRQYRFLYDLARMSEHDTTFELRFISTPHPVPGFPNQLEIVFLGKVFSTRERMGQVLAERLWERFSSVFPIEEPFNYPLTPITDETAFASIFEPLPLDTLYQQNIIEIRKHEELPLETIPHVNRNTDYIVHPLVPNLDFHPMSRFLETLSQQPQKVMASISLRPVRLFDQEIANLSYAVGLLSESAGEATSAAEEYIRLRSALGAHIYNQLILEREQLFLFRVSLIGELEAPYGLADALGSEMMGNAANKYPTQWTLMQPADEREMGIALNNISFLDHQPWGFTIAVPPLQRLRYLVTASEAFGAFRLPVPPENGYLPGIPVTDEPFSAPISAHTIDDVITDTLELGSVYHRGTITEQKHRVTLWEMNRHMLVAGATGSGKSTTIRHVLSQLWKRHQIPFLVLYPLNKVDYRLLLNDADVASELLIFTLGDDNVSPFSFNPLRVPDGTLLKTHISRLMQAFRTAYELYAPLPMIYREALRRAYRAAGWDSIQSAGHETQQCPTMHDFFEHLRSVVDSLAYSGETRDNIRQASIIRIADLLENAGSVFAQDDTKNVAAILEHPTVMEMGRIGATTDTNLVLGFFLASLAGLFERRARTEALHHITVIEEAHRLMGVSTKNPSSPQQSVSDDFANMLSEVREFGEGIIIAEQIPSELIKNAVGNTYVKVMHRLEDEDSFEMFSNIFNLNQQQIRYARMLQSGHVLVRDSRGRPLHVQIIPDQLTETYDISDTGIQHHMQPWFVSNSKVPHSPTDWLDIVWRSSATITKSNRAEQQLMLMAPMQTCAFCVPLLETGNCLYGDSTGKYINNVDLTDLITAFVDCCRQANSEQRKLDLKVLQERLNIKKDDEFYCLLAHLSTIAVRQDAPNAGIYKRILPEFKGENM